MMDDLEKHGFEMVPGVLDADACEALAGLLGSAGGAGRRGLLALPFIAALARSPAILSILRRHLAEEPRPVRGIFFDKSPEANWHVPWHQDLTLAVRARAEVPSFGPWSIKDGIPHVQPPVEFLDRMVTIRLHLDEADERNGALAVLPGTHRFGRLSPERIHSLRNEVPEHLCCAKAGDALLMHPLLLHSSRRSTTARRRRVLHLEYAAFSLPSPLEWHEGA
jgi:ectoine hydroxylase-related dioxygenase (phytanoyl-CoA dioxygenase family)